MEALVKTISVGDLVFLRGFNRLFMSSDGCGCDDPNNCGEGCDGTGCGCDDPGGTFECCGCDDSCTHDIS